MTSLTPTEFTSKPNKEDIVLQANEALVLTRDDLRFPKGRLLLFERVVWRVVMVGKYAYALHADLDIASGRSSH